MSEAFLGDLCTYAAGICNVLAYSCNLGTGPHPSDRGNSRKDFTMNRLTLAAICAAMIAAIAAFPTGASAATTCTPRANIQAIVDDSGSMYGNDTNKLRAEGLKLLLSKNQKKTIGATEFGSDAAPLFAPAVVGPNLAAMNTAIDTLIDSNNGGTDYDAAFQAAAAANPNATARVFLTDGEHNGTYNNSHVGGPPVFAIGLGVTAGSEWELLLQRIAAETGGAYFSVTSSNIQSTINQVDALLNCTTVSQTFTDTFMQPGQTKSRALTVGRTNKSVDLVLTWENPLDTFTIGSIKLVTKNGTIASVSKKRLKITRVAGKTFLNVRVSRLKRGKLRFKLRAATLSTPGAGVNLTTQATKNRTR